MARSLPRLALLASLLAASAALGRAENVLVKADSLTLRAKPDAKADKVAALAAYDIVNVKKRQGEWAQVDAADKKSGWVMSNYLAQTIFVSVDADKLNVRQGPGEKYDVVLKFSRNYPLKVLDRADGGWVKIADCEGDQGWALAKYLSFAPYVITNRDKPANIRKGPGTDSEIAFTSDKGVVLKVIEEKTGWLRVKHQDGDEGWISAKIVFGWLEKTD